jgi:hypothetical protein
MDKEELLTTDEIVRIKMLADLSNWFLETSPPNMIEDNLSPFMDGINNLQRIIMVRAAQRAFPEVFGFDPKIDYSRQLSETFCDPK